MTSHKGRVRLFTVQIQSGHIFKKLYTVAKLFSLKRNKRNNPSLFVWSHHGWHTLSYQVISWKMSYY